MVFVILVVPFENSGICSCAESLPGGPSLYLQSILLTPEGKLSISNFDGDAIISFSGRRRSRGGRCANLSQIARQNPRKNIAISFCASHKT